MYFWGILGMLLPLQPPPLATPVYRQRTSLSLAGAILSSENVGDVQRHGNKTMLERGASAAGRTWCWDNATCGRSAAIVIIVYMSSTAPNTTVPSAGPACPALSVTTLHVEHRSRQRAHRFSASFNIFVVAGALWNYGPSTACDYVTVCGFPLIPGSGRYVG